MTILISTLTLLIGLLAGAIAGSQWAQRVRSGLSVQPVQGAGSLDSPGVRDSDLEERALIRDGLDRLEDELRGISHQSVSWQSQLREQVADIRHSTELLRRETGSLATALRKPQVRGRWGELHLRRCVELAGLVDRCDFSEQHRVATPDGVLIPDLVVHLSGGRSIVVDAKVPLDAFLDATRSDDEAEQAHHLRRHARQMRAHVEALSAKGYWSALPETPDFVVLFVPGDSFLSAALEVEPHLLDHGFAQQVVLATPTTLVALLRTVAMGWQHETLAEKTREIHDLGRELHARLGTAGAHLSKLGRSLDAAVTAYNATVGSLESRVLVTARSFTELGVATEPIEPIAPVSSATRPLTAHELLDAVSPERPELDFSTWSEQISQEDSA